MPDHDPTLSDLWARHQRRVIDVAYRMLGTMSDAEDVAQEVYLRLHREDHTAIDDVEGWLMTVTARLCLDELRSARVRRRAYIGPWLPEPMVSLPDAAGDPADRVTLDDSVRLALLVVLEKLSPAERTAFVLHDVFGVPFGEVAEILGRSIPACRQLASRARRRVHAEQRFTVDRDVLTRVVDDFQRACQAGDLDALVATLDPAVTGEFDSGGLLPGAPTLPVTGARTVASTLLASFDRVSVRFVAAIVNGEPGIVVTMRGRVVTAICLRVGDGVVEHIHAIGNPAKLQHLGVGWG